MKFEAKVSQEKIGI